LYHFGIENIGAFAAANDGIDAKPVGTAYNGTQVARVLYGVQYEGELFPVSGYFRKYGLFENADHLVGCGLVREAFQLLRIDLNHHAGGGCGVFLYPFF
jgi:hypothetical protein